MSAAVMPSPKRVSFGNGGSLVETWIFDDVIAMPAEERHFYQETILKKSGSSLSSSSSSNSANIAQSCLVAPPAGLGKIDDSGAPMTNGKTRANGTKEVHHVTFAESHTEHAETPPPVAPPSASMASNGTVVRDKHVQMNGVTGVYGGCTHSDSVMTDSDCVDCAHNPCGSPTSESSDVIECNGSHSSPGAVLPGKPIIRIKRTTSQESHDNPFMADGDLSKKADFIISHSKISRTELEIADPDKFQEVVAEEIQRTECAPNQASPPADRPNEIKVKGKENGKVDEPLTPQSVEVKVESANATQAEPQQAEQVKLKDSKKCKCCVIM